VSPKIKTSKASTHLLLGSRADSLATATSRASVLATDLEVPVVAETAVEADLLHALDIVTKDGIDLVGKELEVGTLGVVLLPVEEPVGDVELRGVLDDGLHLLDLLLGKLTGTTRENKK
jgi:hypothetical protein